MELKMTEMDYVFYYVFNFENKYYLISSRFSKSTGKDIMILLTFLTFKSAKEIWFFHSLSSSFKNIIKNLMTNDSLKFYDVN